MEYQSGQLVRSRQGRDKGVWYLVLKAENTSVLLTDGRRHPVSRPKRKNIKHIEGTYKIAGSISQQLMTESVPDDVEVKRFIKLNKTEARVEEDSCPSKMQSKWKVLS